MTTNQQEQNELAYASYTETTKTKTSVNKTQVQ